MPYRLTSKSQVTVPRKVREILDIGPGDAIEFDVLADGQVQIRSATTRASHTPSASGRRPPDRFDKVRGRLQTTLSTDQLMALLRPNE